MKGVLPLGKRKCPHCEKYIEDDNYGFHKKYPKRFIHNHCLVEVEKEYKEYLQSERELNQLVEYVAEIHDINKNMIPKLLYTAFRNLNAGRKPFDNTKLTKRLANGVPYDVIKQCYKEQSERIRKIQRDKGFQDVAGEFKYILIVLLNYLPKTLKRMRNEKSSEKRRTRVSKDTTVYKTHEDKTVSKTTDVSKFLDVEEEVDGEMDW